jgi:hypothetical protein
MEEKTPVDNNLLEKLNRFLEMWPDYRSDLTHVLYFSLAVIALLFFNLKTLDMVAGSPVVKVIDVLGLLLLFVAPNWAFIERSQGDRLQPLLWEVDEGEIDMKNPDLVEQLDAAGSYFDSMQRGYPFMIMISAMGIVTLNIIAYMVYGSVAG